ncbi:hypothetical protein OG308_18025 [Nocardia salmonicida]|uniref:Uncharacterized protein n=1 Tax=Nocardia salmonicida TaxID=53431 RepID=A0ABZ1MZZ4_9NOCA
MPVVAGVRVEPSVSSLLGGAIVAGLPVPPADGGPIKIAALAIIGGLLETLLAWIDGQLDSPLDQVLELFIDKLFIDISVGTMERPDTCVTAG